MRSTRCTRRDCLTMVGGGFLFAGHPLSSCVATADTPSGLFTGAYISAYMDEKKRFGVAILDGNGKIIARHPLPGRGHGTAIGSASAWLVTFARRPGNFALAVHLHQAKRPVLFKSPSHTHFYGHGVFSRDGKRLFATENRFESGEGVIGIYDATNNFARLGEFSSYGIGPHALILMPDGLTLCVANGGILTHPDTGRAMLNLHDMRSAIAFIDSRHGTLVRKIDIGVFFQRLSFRHMAVDNNNRVWIGGQYHGERKNEVPLIATADLQNGLEFPDLGPVGALGLAGYIGSVVRDVDGQRIAFSSPKGNTLLVVDANNKTVLSKQTINAVCGIAHTRDGFLTTGLSGEINQVKQPVRWDNHITNILGTYILNAPNMSPDINNHLF